MFLLLKAKLRLALRTPVCCFPILSPLDFLADVQDQMILPHVSRLPCALAAEQVHQEPQWCQQCHPAIARLEVPSISCTGAVMLCTEPATVVTVSLMINPSHPSFLGWQVPTGTSAVLCTHASAQLWQIWSLQSSGTSYLKLMGKP